MTTVDPLENVRAWWDEDAELDLDAYEPAFEPEPSPGRRRRTADQPAAQPGQDFVHLHVHSEFSLLDGLSPVKHVVETAKRNGMRAVALTDHGNMYGAIDFYSYAKSAGIKPIIGVETYVSPRGMSDKVGNQDRNYFHLVLLAKNLERLPQPDQAGLAREPRGLLLQAAHRPRAAGRARQRADRAERAATAASRRAPSSTAISTAARDAAAWYRDVFGEDYFLELQDHGNPDDQVVNDGLIEIHKQLGIPLVVTNDTPLRAARAGAAPRTSCCASRPTAPTSDPEAHAHASRWAPSV